MAKISGQVRIVREVIHWKECVGDGEMEWGGEINRVVRSWGGENSWKEYRTV